MKWIINQSNAKIIDLRWKCCSNKPHIYTFTHSISKSMFLRVSISYDYTSIALVTTRLSAICATTGSLLRYSIRDTHAFSFSHICFPQLFELAYYEWHGRCDAYYFDDIHINGFLGFIKRSSSLAISKRFFFLCSIIIKILMKFI